MIVFEHGASERTRFEFVDRFPAETIEEIFRESIAQLKKNARVDTFVPLLVERRTRERLTPLWTQTLDDVEDCA